VITRSIAIQLLSRSLWRNKQSVGLKFQKSTKSAFNILYQQTQNPKNANNYQLQFEIYWFSLKSVYFIYCRISILIFLQK